MKLGRMMRSIRAKLCGRPTPRKIEQEQRVAEVAQSTAAVHANLNETLQLSKQRVRQSRLEIIEANRATRAANEALRILDRLAQKKERGHG